MLKIDNTFSTSYECTTLDSWLSTGITAYCYPGGLVGCRVDGLYFKITPYSDAHEPWVGSFAWGELSPNALTGVYSHPSAIHLLVIAKGEAYIVNTENPLQYQHLNIMPVMGMVPVPDLGLIILYDFTRLEGYNAKGEYWHTPSLSWDGLRNVRYNGTSILGEGWDSPNNTWVQFCVNPIDGSFTGGASSTM